MVECPQCGHSLMNARNRTAEALAVKLTQLRGDRVKTILPSQALLVTVGNPQKVGKGLFAYVAYRYIQYLVTKSRAWSRNKLSEIGQIC